MRISDWSSDVCSSDLSAGLGWSWAGLIRRPDRLFQPAVAGWSRRWSGRFHLAQRHPGADHAAKQGNQQDGPVAIHRFLENSCGIGHRAVDDAQRLAGPKAGRVEPDIAGLVLAAADFRNYRFRDQIGRANV